MAVQPLSGVIPIPKNIHPAGFLITINIGGVDTDVSADLISISATRKDLRSGVGEFTIVLFNYEGKFTNSIEEGRTIRIYADHKTIITSSDNQIYQGKIINFSFGLSTTQGWVVTITGKDSPEAIDFTFSTTFNQVTYNNAITTIIDNEFSSVYTYTGVITDTTTSVSGGYSNQNFSNMLADILEQADYNGYIGFATGTTRDIVTFKDDGSNINDRENIVFGNNMAEFGGFEFNFDKEKNINTVYGKSQDEIQLIATKENTASQNRLWKKSNNINAGDLDTRQAVINKAVAVNKLNVGEQIGSLTAIGGLPTLQPGQWIYCSAQYARIEGYYRVIEFTHNISAGGWTTIVNLTRKIKDTSTLLKELKAEITSTSISNPNNMKDTPIWLTFDTSTDILSLGNNTLTGGKLVLNTTFAQSTTTSRIVVLDYNATSFEIRAKPNDHCRVSYLTITNTGRASYNDTNKRYNLITDLKKQFNFTTSGKEIAVDITLVSDSTNTNPELDSVEIMTK